MIPTQYKAKLSHTMTWPIGASAITEGLCDAPHVADLSLWFGDGPVWRASEFQRILRDAQPYAILVAEYEPPLKYAQALHLVKWRLQVNPVPRPLRFTANTLLRAEGLPAIAAWLHSSTADGWDGRGHRLELIFAPASGTLSSKTFDGI